MGQWTKDVNEGMDIINELPSHQPDMRHILGYTLQKGKSLGCLGAAFTISWTHSFRLFLVEP